MSKESQTTPSERPRLPTREEIFAIKNVDELLSLRDSVERAQKQIEVDLSYSNRGDEWAARARAALAAHDICIGNIGRRIKTLTKGHNAENIEKIIELKNAKVSEKSVHQRNRELNIQQQTITNESKKIALQNRKLDMIEKSYFFRNFYFAAKTYLTSEDFENIENEAARINGTGYRGAIKSVVYETPVSQTIHEERSHHD